MIDGSLRKNFTALLYTSKPLHRVHSLYSWPKGTWFYLRSDNPASKPRQLEADDPVISLWPCARRDHLVEKPALYLDAMAVFLLDDSLFKKANCWDHMTTHVNST